MAPEDDKILYFHNYKKIVFSAASRQEAKSIQKKFNEAKIFLNLNFIPFKPSNEKVQKFEKKFVFFGRANPHKNIEKIIKGFIKSNLPHDWKLDLFCIDDNLKYLEMLKNKYLDYKNVRFNTPVFGARKNNIMSRSWANIIMSDSEVLSLSILECGINGLPTIINLDIEIVKEDKFSPTCKPDEEDIANKIIEVANWSEQDRYDISIQLKDVYKKYLYKEYDFKEEFKK